MKKMDYENICCHLAICNVFYVYAMVAIWQLKKKASFCNCKSITMLFEKIAVESAR